MPISVCCSQCGKKYQLRDELAGKAAKCPCGQTMTIPKTEPPVAVAVADPPAAANDPFAGLADDWPSQGTTLAPLGKIRKRSGRKAHNPYLIAAIAGGAGLVVLFVVVVVMAISRGGSGTDASPGGAPSASARWPTPEAVFEAAKHALVAKDWGTFFDTLSPRSQSRMVQDLAGVPVMAQSLPEALVGEQLRPLREVATKYGLGKVPKPTSPGDMAAYAEKCRAEADAIADKRAFVVEVTAIVDALAKSPGMAQTIGARQEALLQALQTAQLTEVRITGDTATGALTMSSGGQTKRDTARFVKIDGDWRNEDESPGAQTPPGIQPAAAEPPGSQMPQGMQPPPGLSGPPPGPGPF